MIENKMTDAKLERVAESLRTYRGREIDCIFESHGSFGIKVEPLPEDHVQTLVLGISATEFGDLLRERSIHP